MNNLTFYILMWVLANPDVYDKVTDGGFSEAELRHALFGNFDGLPAHLQLFVREALKLVDMGQVRYHVNLHVAMKGELGGL